MANSRQRLLSPFFSARARYLYVWAQVWQSANVDRCFPNLLTHAFRVKRSGNISHFDSPRFGCVDSIVLRSRRRCEAQWPERYPREFISIVPRKVLRCSIRYGVPLKKRDWNKIANRPNLQTEQEQQWSARTVFFFTFDLFFFTVASLPWLNLQFLRWKIAHGRSRISRTGASIHRSHAIWHSTCC